LLIGDPKGLPLQWTKLPERFPNFELDVFQIMPDHIPGILLLNDCVVQAGFTPAHNHSHEGQPQGIAMTSDKINPGQKEFSSPVPAICY
jgi:hypothetical protein